MTVLSSAIASFITRELNSALSKGKEGKLRVSFSGPPVNILETLFTDLTNEHGHLTAQNDSQTLKVGVFLLKNSGFKDPEVQTLSAICSESHYVGKVRNNPNIPYSLALQDYASALKSVESVVSRIGMYTAYSDFKSWVESSLISSLVTQIIIGISHVSRLPPKNIETALLKCLETHWGEHGQSETREKAWEALGSFGEISHFWATPEDVISKNLGFFRCAPESFGKEVQFTTSTKIAEYFEQRGLTSGFNELLNSAQDTLLRDSLEKFGAYIRSQGVIEASEYSKRYLDIISHAWDAPNSPPSWWQNLTIEVWRTLIDIDVSPPLENFTLEPLDTIKTYSKSLPNLALTSPKFQIVTENLPEASKIIIERSNGTSPFQTVATLTTVEESPTVFEDKQAPKHKTSIRYKAKLQDGREGIIKFIALEHYEPGIVIASRSSSNTKQFKKNAKSAINLFESNAIFPSTGSHQLDFYFNPKIKFSNYIEGHEVNVELDEVLPRPINLQSETSAVCLIEINEGCRYEFEVILENEKRVYKINITGGNEQHKGVASEFDKLILSHSSIATKELSSARVEPLTTRLSTIEEWILGSDDSFCPLILGSDYLDCWVEPDWKNLPKLTNLKVLIDPRPQDFIAKTPESYRIARGAILNKLRPTGDDYIQPVSLIRFSEHMQDSGFRNLLELYLNEYRNWLEADFETAIWSDLIALFHHQPSVPNALAQQPYAVLLTPYHPIRLAWQCQAQSIMADALAKHLLCPAASSFTPNRFPDCLVLRCQSATGGLEPAPYVAAASSNNYWSVLVNVVVIGSTHDLSGMSGVTESLGLKLQGFSRGFSEEQVKQSMNEVSRLLAGRSQLKLSLVSEEISDSGCNAGLENWTSENFGENADVWFNSGARSLKISDTRHESLLPEQSALASLTNATKGAVKWFAKKKPEPGQDLSIIAHLGTMNHQFDRQGLRAVSDFTGMVKRRIRKQSVIGVNSFVSESFVSLPPNNMAVDTITLIMLSSIDLMEAKCAEIVDSQSFAPNLATLAEVIEGSAYTAVSSSNIDAACFFGAANKAYLWDFELPRFSSKAGESLGYFLLATHSDSMISAVKEALSLLGTTRGTSDETIQNMLQEVSKRGMPTLKKLTGGGTVSLGELGMLSALKVLQNDFTDPQLPTGLIPVIDSGKNINLIVPVDPFQKHFEDLRRALQEKSGGRPDLLVLSVAYTGSGDPIELLITPLEIKARRGTMSSGERQSACTQASYFSNFLKDFQTRAAGEPLWGIAWRAMISDLLDYAFRVYGQLHHLMKLDEWSALHTYILKKINDGMLDIRIDARGRLLSVEGVDQSAPMDMDSDSFKETIVVSHDDAVKLLLGDSAELLASIKAKIGNWQLLAEVNIQNQHEPLPEAPVIATSPQAPAEVPSNSTEKMPALPPDPLTPDIKDTQPELLMTGLKFTVGKTVGAFKEQELEFFPGNTELNQLNIGIVGDLGTGKTQLIQGLIHQLRLRPADNRDKAPNILIFDYKRDYSKEAFIKATGAKVIKPFDIPLNFFDIRDSAQGPKAWLERSKFFTDVLAKIYGGIGAAQNEYIKQAVKKAYENAGTSKVSMPTLTDVFNEYRELKDGAIDSPYSIMSDLVDGGYFVENAAQAIPFSKFLDGIVVIDLSAVGQDDKTKNMLVVVFLNLFYEHMLKIQKREFIGTEPKLRFVDSMLLVDEADNIMKYEFDVLKKILLQGREFGVGVLLASQYLSHYKTKHENYLEPLLTWFIHKVPQISAADLGNIGLPNPSAQLANEIKSLECHQCLYKSLNVDGKIIRGIPFFEMLKTD